MVFEKPKYKLLLAKYRETLKEIRDIEIAEIEAYTSDLDIDLTND
jgi:hypothetical protein